MQNGNVNTTTTISYNRDPSLLNGIKSFSKNFNIGQDLRVNYNFKEKLNIGINAGLEYTLAQYTVQPQQRDDYYTNTYGAEATYTFEKGFILATDIDVIANTGRSDGFNQRYALWNASFAKQLFKNNRGELRASVFDILNNAQSFVRTVGESYIEDVETRVLKRFFLLSFTYKLSRMGGRDGQKGQRNQMGRMYEQNRMRQTDR
jgi:Outer membrane protein beta-barrel family